MEWFTNQVVAVVSAGVVHGSGIKQPARNVTANVKSLLNQEVTVLFTVRIVSPNVKIQAVNG